MRRCGYLLPVLCGLALACGSPSESGLSTRFGDCAAPPCEVALEAFTRDLATLPHCMSARENVELVGAKWAPDSHPVQFAGEQLPARCQLTPVCDT